MFEGNDINYLLVPLIIDDSVGGPPYRGAIGRIPSWTYFTDNQFFFFFFLFPFQELLVVELDAFMDKLSLTFKGIDQGIKYQPISTCLADNVSGFGVSNTI